MNLDTLSFNLSPNAVPMLIMINTTVKRDMQPRSQALFLSQETRLNDM